MADLAPVRIESLIFYGGIGIQEGEGSGDYAFEHFKYAAGYGFLVVGPELVPHFGLVGRRCWRHTFIRNFWDSDQRPLCSVLGAVDRRKTPMLIMHGQHDRLVPAWVAREHHRLVAHSDLIMYDAGHLMLFSPEGGKELANQIVQFVEHHRHEGAAPRRLTLDFSRVDASPVALPLDLNLQSNMNPWRQMVLLVAGTFVSEDLTCISAGLLINRHQLDLILGLLGCFLGILLGDIGL